jgi:hypothetical protein
MSTRLPPAQHGAVLAGVKATPSGVLRPALTPAAGDAHQQRPGVRQKQGSDKIRSPRFQGIAAGLRGRLAERSGGGRGGDQPAANGVRGRGRRLGASSPRPTGAAMLDQAAGHAVGLTKRGPAWTGRRPACRLPRPWQRLDQVESTSRSD